MTDRERPAGPAVDEAGRDPETSPDVVDAAYRRLFESHPAAMAIWEPATGRILAANEAAARQYGYDPEDLVGLPVDRIVHPDDLARLREQVPNLPAGLAAFAPFRHVRRNGEVIEVEMSGHPLTWDGRSARLVMAIDVTARRRLEQELRAARAIEAVGRLAGGIAHDFNNLVMAINGFAELLLDRLPDGTDEHDAAVEIRTAGLRAAGLTSQLLAFARPHEPHPTRFDLNELLQGMDATLRSLSGPNVHVRIVATAQRATIEADRDQIARAIVGCVLNARDAMPDGGDLRIETADVDAGDAHQLAGAAGDQPYVGLAISDSGPTGILSTVEPVVVGRTGLGLALVYSTVQMAGGRIRLESMPGHGSTVRILLPVGAAERVAGTDPLAVAEPVRGSDIGTMNAAGARPARTTARPSGPIDETQPESAPAGAGGRTSSGTGGPDRSDLGSALIAVVEDEPGVRALVERVLVRGGHRVLAFPDGATALDTLLHGTDRVDLLLTDLVMPGSNGFEVARRFRRDRPDLPVLLMSGYAADALNAEGIAEGEIEILAKPFSASELLDRVAAVLASRASRA